MMRGPMTEPTPVPNEPGEGFRTRPAPITGPRMSSARTSTAHATATLDTNNVSDIALWRIDTGEYIRTISTGYRGVVSALAWRRDGEAIAAAVGLRPEIAGVLTTRKREILQLIAEGHTTKEIAALLHRSEKTIEGHRSRLMSQLGIRDVVGLVRYAIRIGLIPPDR